MEIKFKRDTQSRVKGDEMEMRDKTGQPRSDEELQEAIDCVSQIMVKQPMVLPLFTIHAGIIRDCLLELQSLRKFLKEVQRKRLGGT